MKIALFLLALVLLGYAYAEEPTPPAGFRKVEATITYRVKATRPGKATVKSDTQNGTNRLCMQMCVSQTYPQRSYIAVSYDVSNLPHSITNKAILPPGPGWIERNGCVYFPYTEGGTNWVHTIYESVGLGSLRELP